MDERMMIEKYYILYKVYKKCIFFDIYNIVLYILKMIIKIDSLKVL